MWSARIWYTALAALAACTGEISGERPGSPDAPPALPADAPPAPDAAGALDAASPGDCPADMLPVAGACMDRFEAPDLAGARPLVMYTFDEAEAWCRARGKRLCFDDEWTAACAGPQGFAYPYGATRIPGRCNDAKVWKTYDQTLLSAWPIGVSRPEVGSLEELLAAARARGTQAAASADHVEWLYQAEGSGAYPGCVGDARVVDLVGSVEEWTRRRDGGQPMFHGNLKGRYWAESRTCQQGVITHGDAFRFYEIGFRCCKD